MGGSHGFQRGGEGERGKGSVIVNIQNKGKGGDIEK